MQIKLCHLFSISVFVTEWYWSAKQKIYENNLNKHENNENKWNF